MKKILSIVLGLSLLGLNTSCVSSQFHPLTQHASANASADSVTIFILERDLPPQIDRLGVATFRTYRSGMGVHNQVKQQLQQEAHQRGANGAFRLREGTYDRLGIFAYLLFRYKTQ